MLWFFQKLTEFEQRMLKVEDPIEMRCEPGTEIVIAADREAERSDRGDHHEMHAPHHVGAPILDGLGHRTPTGAPPRR